MKKSKILKRLSSVALIVTMLATMLAAVGTTSVYATSDPIDYEPKNVLLISSWHQGGALNASWRNPKNALSKVTLTNITDGGNTVLSDTLDTTASASVEYHIAPAADLTQTKTYTYKLTFDFADGQKREVIMSQKPFAYDTANTTVTGKQPKLLASSNSWNLTYGFADGSSNKNVLSTNVTVDTANGYGGTGAALHIQTNKDADAIRPTSVTGTSTTNWTNGFWTRLDVANGVGSANLQAQKYRVSFMAKTKNLTLTTTGGGARRVYLGNKDITFAEGDWVNANEWKAVSQDFDLTAVSSRAGGLRMYLPLDDVEDMWIDNVQVYLLDSEGNPTGSNLLTVGDFETYTAANAVTDESAVAGDKTATINFTAPSDSRYVRIYEKGTYNSNDQWYLRAICEPTQTSVVLDGLTNGTTYNYKIESQSVLGVFSTPVIVSATPVAAVSDPMDYEPKNVLLISGHLNGANLNASWRNPVKALSKVTLTDITDAANPIKLSDTLDTTAGASVEYHISQHNGAALNVANTYTYKLTFDFADGQKREVVMSQKPFAYDTQNTKVTGKQPKLLAASGSWNLTYRFAELTTGNIYTLPTNVTVDTANAYGGTGASLHIQTNKDADAVRPDSGLNWTNGHWVRLDVGSGVGAADLQAQKYKVSFMAKTKGLSATAGGARRVYFGNSESTFVADDLNDAEDWTEVSQIIDLTSVTNRVGGLRMYLPTDDVEDMWIDNVEVHLLDGNGDPTGDNLLTVGDFETYTAANAVSGQSAVAGNKTATINFTAPSDSRYVRIYEKGEHLGSDQWYLRAICEPTQTSAVLGGLTNGTTYNYKIESQSVYGVFSAPVTVSATPVAPPYEINGDYSISPAAVTGNGTYTVSLDVTNNTTPSFAPALIVALYKDDILVSCDKSDSLLAANEIKNTLSASVTISGYDSAAKYEIYSFFWDGFNTMKPLKETFGLWDNVD